MSDVECRCPCHESTLNGTLPTHTGPCSCTVMSPEAVDLLNDLRDGDTTQMHALMDADPLPMSAHGMSDGLRERRCSGCGTPLREFGGLMTCDHDRCPGNLIARGLVSEADPTRMSPPDASTSAGEGLSEADGWAMASLLAAWSESLWTLPCGHGAGYARDCHRCVHETLHRSEWLANIKAAAATKARAEAGEQIAQAIEARGRQFDHRYAQDLFTDAARIARGDA